MKQKLILLALVIGLTIVSQSSLSLGMGKIQVYSALNEPLRSSIELITNVDEELQNLEVNLASSEDYQKVGLDKSFVPSNILVSFDEENPYQINVTSNGPVTEPIVSLLLDVNWNNGRILREFTILLDPPVYESSTDVQVNNVVVEPIQNDVIEESVVEEPMADTDGSSPVLQPREETTTTYTNEDVPSDTTTELTTSYDNAGSDVFVEAGDTLWRIANNNRGDLSTHQMMMAIYNSNPNAFIDNNINQLIKGSRLTMPSGDEASSIGYSEALAQVESHHQSWSPSQQDYTAYQTQDTSDTTYEEPESNLDYGVQLSGGDSDGSDSGQSNSDEGTATDVQAMEEDLYNKDSENTDLKERISELEDIVEQQQEVIEISDDSLANLENQAANLTDDTTTAVDETLASVDEATDDIWDTADDTSTDTSTDVTNDDLVDDVADDPLNLTVDTAEVIDEVVDDTSNETDQSTGEATQQESTSPPKFAGAEESESMVDTAINWVMDNLKWVLIGLVGLIVLLFLPRVLRRNDDGDDDDTSFLDDIKKRNDDAEAIEDVEDSVETKMNEPLVDEDFTEEADSEDDVLAELDKSIMFDESSDSSGDESDDFVGLSDEDTVDVKDDDGFDLDGFLNDDEMETDELSNDMSVTADHSSTMAGVSFDEDEDEDEGEASAEDSSDDGDDLFDDFDLDLDAAEGFAEDVEAELENVEESLDDIEDAAEEAVEDVADAVEEVAEDDFSFDEDFDFDLDEELDELEQEDDIAISEDDSEDDADEDFNDMLDISEADTETFDIDDDEEVGMDEELDLGLEDLLEEGDAIDTKLDLAKAYIDMGDAEGAKNLLDEIVSEGTAEQVEAAKKLIDDM